MVAKTLGPVPCRMHHSKDFHLICDAVDDDVGQIGEDELSRVPGAAAPSQHRVRRQASLGTGVESQGNAIGSSRAIFRDVVLNLVKVGKAGAVQTTRISWGDTC